MHTGCLIRQYNSYIKVKWQQILVTVQCLWSENPPGVRLHVLLHGFQLLKWIFTL